MDETEDPLLNERNSQTNRPPKHSYNSYHKRANNTLRERASRASERANASLLNGPPSPESMKRRPKHTDNRRKSRLEPPGGSFDEDAIRPSSSNQEESHNYYVGALNSPHTAISNLTTSPEQMPPDLRHAHTQSGTLAAPIQLSDYPLMTSNSHPPGHRHSTGGAAPAGKTEFLWKDQQKQQKHQQQQHELFQKQQLATRLIALEQKYTQEAQEWEEEKQELERRLRDAERSKAGLEKQWVNWQQERLEWEHQYEQEQQEHYEQQWERAYQKMQNQLASGEKQAQRQLQKEARQLEEAIQKLHREEQAVQEAQKE